MNPHHIMHMVNINTSGLRISLVPTILAILFFLSASVSYAQDTKPSSVKLRITGEIDSGSQTSSLWILRQNDTPHNPTAEVPIVNGKIDFVFETSEPDRFTFISVQDLFEKGTCMPVDFFAEEGEIRLTGKDIEEEPQCLKLQLVESSSPLNLRLMEHNQFRKQNYNNRLDSLSRLAGNLSDEELYSAEGRAFWKEFYALMDKINVYPDSLPLLQQRNEMFHTMESLQKQRLMNSERYYALLYQMNKVSNQMLDYEIETFGGSDGDFFSLSVLCEDFFKTYDNDAGKSRIIDVYRKNYQQRFSNTLMGRRMNEATIGFEVNHIGGQYPDYQLPDAEGNMHSIKNLIDGRVVLIDLWGSTCGPCRVNSHSMIPVYEQFKDKGFDIIGIAREYGSLNGFFKAVEKDGYPWRQLIELDDATGVFNLHGIPNAMGGTYLVGPANANLASSETYRDTDTDPKPDSDIRVLLINPTAEELRQFLTSYFSSKQ